MSNKHKSENTIIPGFIFYQDRIYTRKFSTLIKRDQDIQIVKGLATENKQITELRLTITDLDYTNLISVFGKINKVSEEVKLARLEFKIVNDSLYVIELDVNIKKLGIQKFLFFNLMEYLKRVNISIKRIILDILVGTNKNLLLKGIMDFIFQEKNRSIIYSICQINKSLMNEYSNFLQKYENFSFKQTFFIDLFYFEYAQNIIRQMEYLVRRLKIQSQFESFYNEMFNTAVTYTPTHKTLIKLADFEKYELIDKSFLLPNVTLHYHFKL